MGLSASKIFVSFPFECLEDIWQHLDGEGLLKRTLVCHSWNECIGSSRWFMKKMFIRCPEDADLYDLNNVLLGSKRSTIALMCMAFIQTKCENIYSVLCFVNVNDFLDFLLNIRTSIQTLALYGEIIEEEFKPDKKCLDLQFP